VIQPIEQLHELKRILDTDAEQFDADEERE
jgi:hypothetical protein